MTGLEQLTVKTRASWNIIESLAICESQIVQHDHSKGDEPDRFGRLRMNWSGTYRVHYMNSMMGITLWNCLAKSQDRIKVGRE